MRSILKVSASAVFTCLVSMKTMMLASIFLSGLLFFACKKEKIQPPINTPPVAMAGNDALVRLSCTASMLVNSFELDGSSSYDVDGRIASYKWTALSAPPGYSIQSPDNKRTVVENASSGTYQFELTVTDMGGLSSKDTVIVTVINENAEYNLDITLSTKYTFSDNVLDPWQYAIDSANFDLTEILSKLNISPLGEFDVSLQEYSDTAALSDEIYYDFFQISMGHVDPLYILGPSSINLKKLIRQGGGLFSGSVTIMDGSAKRCRPGIFLSLPPLQIQGNLDVNTQTVTLQIKGSVFF